MAASARARGGVLVLTLAALTGCGASWHQTALLPPGPLEPRQQVQVWRGGQVNRWHAVVLTADSISGIPYLSPIACDSCRVVFPRDAVDSIQIGNPVAGFWKTAALVVALPMVAVEVGCILAGRFPSCWPTRD